MFRSAWLLLLLLASCGGGDGETDADAMVGGTPFTPGDTLRGAIAPTVYPNVDTDVYVGTLEKGMVLELEFTRLGDGLEPSIIVRSNDYLRTVICEDCSRAAQFFIPHDGAYTVVVSDRRAQLPGMRYGGHGDAYEIATRLVAPMPIGPLTTASCEPTRDSMTMGPPIFPCPGGVTTGTIEDSEIAIYTLATSTDLALMVEGLERIDVYDLTDEVLLDPHADLADPTRKGLHGGHDHLFVIEPLSPLVTPRPFHYEVQSWLAHDDSAAPRALPLDRSVSGEIAALDGDAFDSDFFVVRPASDVRIEVTAASEDLEPILSSYGDIHFRALPEGRTVAMELMANTPIRVDDLRNVPTSGVPANVGGSTSTYTIEALAAPRVPVSIDLPASETSSIGQGSYAWYAFTQPPRSLVYVSAAASAGRVAVVQVGSEPAPNIASTPAVLENADESPVGQTLGVRDVGFRSLTVDVSFLLFELEDPARPTVSEVEPNDTVAEAQSVSADVTVTGATEGLSSTDPGADVFAITLNAGETLGVHLESVIAMSEVDGEFEGPFLRFRDSSGAILDERSNFFVATVDGEVYVEIIPSCYEANCTNVEYVAQILTR